MIHTVDLVLFKRALLSEPGFSGFSDFQDYEFYTVEFHSEDILSLSINI